MNFFEQMCAQMRAGQQVALVTVVRTEGSVPRKAGAKMLVSSEGRLLGTIGGGCPEAEASLEATETAKNGGCKLCRVEMRHTKDDLKSKPADAEVLVCGGLQEILLEPLSAEIPNGQLLLKVGECIKRGDNPSALLAVWQEGSEASPLSMRCGTMIEANMQRFVCWADGRIMSTNVHPIPEEWKEALLGAARQAAKTHVPQISGLQMGALKMRLYAEPYVKPQRLIIAGAGHVAVPLCRVASMCGYEVTVYDDRAEFATAERFPDAVQITNGDFTDLFTNLDIDDFTSIVIITRGHRCDEQCLHAINGRPSAYLGMIGSHHRVGLVRESLRELGYAQEWIDSLHAPIGIDIGAETPEEIAVAIVAQMIAHRNDRELPCT